VGQPAGLRGKAFKNKISRRGDLKKNEEAGGDGVKKDRDFLRRILGTLWFWRGGSGGHSTGDGTAKARNVISKIGPIPL